MLGLGLLSPQRAAAERPLAQVETSGWSAQLPDPTAVGAPLLVQRQGFDAAAAPRRFPQEVALTARIREPYPNHQVLSADRVSLSDFIYQGDQIVGAANNSTRPAPRPIAMWLTPDFEHIRTPIARVQLAVAHAHARAGRPVAAVRFTVSDGSTSASVLVNTMTPVAFSETGLTVPCFEAELDLSALAEGTVTVDATIYPWVGAAMTLSEVGSAGRANIGPLQLVNDHAGGVGTAYAYVDAAGDDTFGVASGADTAAQAAPFASLRAAVAAARAFNNANFGRDNAGGAVVVVNDGGHVWQDIAGQAGTTEYPLVIRGQSRAGAVLSDAGSNTTTSIPDHMRFENITLRKTGGSLIMLDNGSGDDAGLLVFDAVTLDQNGTSSYGAWIYRVGRLIARNSDLAALVNAFGTAAKHVALIGSRDSGSGAALYNAAGSRMVTFSNLHAGAGGRVPARGQLCSHSFISQASASGRCLSSVAPIGPEGFAVIGTVMEAVSGSTAPAVRLNADGNLDPVENLVFLGNTVIGSRVNWLYQDVGSTTVEKSGYRSFNVQLLQNCKSDVFGADPALNGNWSEIYNVGNSHNMALQGSNQNDIYGAGSWLGEVAGVGDVNGSEASPLDPRWVHDASVSGTGAGQGEYRPQLGTDVPVLPAALAPYSHDQNGRALAEGSYIGALCG
ncbi:hypothetical protein GG681_15925 [Epibacterium sp. SM1969]|uniref:Uncharacterized protein n=1 Tax=Tritonibacter aquimaris TaxID=2663379 RepID=A0A844B0R0_9RHOB|nr:hypothetical protein [Tritonibacter aquimaris]MQY44134.1 hypothetical protein [Tritonibacter aquimaris]